MISVGPNFPTNCASRMFLKWFFGRCHLPVWWRLWMLCSAAGLIDHRAWIVRKCVHREEKYCEEKCGEEENQENWQKVVLVSNISSPVNMITVVQTHILLWSSEWEKQSMCIVQGLFLLVEEKLTNTFDPNLSSLSLLSDVLVEHFLLSRHSEQQRKEKFFHFWGDFHFPASPQNLSNLCISCVSRAETGGDSGPDLITKVKGVGRPWIGGHCQSWRGWKKFSKVVTSVCPSYWKGMELPFCWKRLTRMADLAGQPDKGC